MITLEQLLLSREDRARHQQDLLGKNPGRSLVCLTVQLPGSRKRSPASLTIGKAGVQALRQAFPGPDPRPAFRIRGISARFSSCASGQAALLQYRGFPSTGTPYGHRCHNSRRAAGQDFSGPGAAPVSLVLQSRALLHSRPDAFGAGAS